MSPTLGERGRATRECFPSLRTRPKAKHHREWREHITSGGNSIGTCLGFEAGTMFAGQTEFFQCASIDSEDFILEFALIRGGALYFQGEGKEMLAMKGNSGIRYQDRVLLLLGLLSG